jgi:hypothetical protein
MAGVAASGVRMTGVVAAAVTDEVTGGSVSAEMAATTAVAARASTRYARHRDHRSDGGE